MSKNAENHGLYRVFLDGGCLISYEKITVRQVLILKAIVITNEIFND